MTTVTSSILVLLTSAVLWGPALCFTTLATDRRQHPTRGSTSWKLCDATPAQTDLPVQVFNNAFPPCACELLHDLAQEHNDRSNDGSSIFTRPPHNSQPLTPLEQAIHSALSEMGDTSSKVEYWSRDEYMNIDVHADIDEGMLEDGEGLRCPLTGHVLYLYVQAGLIGPTCVFPEKLMGWTSEDDNDAIDPGTEMVVVPAVQGRILRFPGSAMHAVPKPPTRWKCSPREQRSLSEEDDPDDYEYLSELDEIGDWDDSSQELDEVERSVLLFNTWPDDEPPPRGVDPDFATGGLPEGMELDDDDDEEQDDESTKESELSRFLAEWEERIGKKGERVRCNPRREWIDVSFDRFCSAESKGGSINVSLMGNQRRRLYPQKYVSLACPGDDMELAFEEPVAPSVVCLRKNGS